MSGHSAQSRPTLVLDGRTLTLEGVAAGARGAADVSLSDGAWRRIAAGRAVVDAIVDRGEPAYGITTGVGSHKDFGIRPDERGAYGCRLVRAHGTRGPGRSAAADLLRGALIVQLNLFATGASGVRRELAAALLEWLRQDEWPDVRLGQSVGASDLMALGQLADALLDRFDAAGPAGVGALAPKEGLSLLNSNCLTLAQGALALLELERLTAALDTAAAFTLEGFRGNAGAWAERSDRLHPQPGQRIAGAHLRQLLAGSGLWEPGAPRLLQDPLSLRCVPQVHGSCYSALAWAREVWETELNAVVDNPAVDLEAGELFSHGNMETTLLSVCLDAVRGAVAKAVESSGERLHKSQWPDFTGLPTGLAGEPGPTGGVQFLALGHLGAANVAACKIAAMPVTPHYRGQICDGVEDIGGLAPFAVAECERLAEAAWNVVAVETIVGVWAIARRGLTAARIGAGLRAPYQAIRPLLPIGREGERLFDIGPIVDLLRNREPPPPRDSHGAARPGDGEP